MTDPKTSLKAARRLVLRTRFLKFFAGLNAGFGLLLMLALWGMFNYLSSRHYTREDWSRQQLSVLSEKTEAVLQALDRPVRLIVFAGKEFRAGPELDDLLKEYQSRTPLIQVETVDPQRDLGPAEDLITRYEVKDTEQLIVVSRDNHHVIDLAEMVVLESDETRPMGETPRMVGFQGETLITSSLLRLTQLDRPVVYFLTGHGEKDIDLFEAVQQGYSDVRERLTRDNVDVRKLNLEDFGRIPEDCSALVIAGPATRIAQPELDLIRRYLEHEGRMMVLLDTLQDGGLDPLLQEWGIQLLPDLVVDPSKTITGADVNIIHYAEHPVTRGMQGVRSIFIRPRSILPVPNGATGADRPQYKAIAACTEKGWAEVSLDEQPVRFDPDLDQAGPIPVAAVVEKGGGETASLSTSPARLVVFGDSDFASNWLKNGGGMMLFQNAVNWLVDRDQLIAIPPAPVDEIRLGMDQSGLNRLLFLVAVVMPGMVAFLGLIIAFRRRT